MLSLVNFSNLWSGSYDHKHNTLKHHEAQFLGNKMLKDEIKQITQKKSIKTTIKRMRDRIKELNRKEQKH